MHVRTLEYLHACMRMHACTCWRIDQMSRSVMKQLEISRRECLRVVRVTVEEICTEPSR